jgi:hypothetical protein
MDAQHTRALVLEFRRPRQVPGRTRRRAAVFRPSYPPRGGGDEMINADWDLLIRVASHAWSWRDPESLGTLEEIVGRLRQWIERDWSA